MWRQMGGELVDDGGEHADAASRSHTTHPCTDVSVVVSNMVPEKRPTRANTVTTACHTFPKKENMKILC